MVTEQNTAAQVARLREKANNVKASAKACRLKGYYALADEEQSWGELFSAAADALEREAGLVADSERLTWMINESNSAGGWIADHVWDDATKLCAVDYDEADDVQKWVRAAIDAMRGPQ
jgi:hypothetical protein